VNAGESKEKVLEYTSKHGYHWTNLMLAEGDKTAEAWGASGIPVIALVAPDGKVAYSQVGFDESIPEAVRSRLSKIDPKFANGVAASNK
jgi:hypothetical protein